MGIRSSSVRSPCFLSYICLYKYLNELMSTTIQMQCSTSGLPKVSTASSLAPFRWVQRRTSRPSITTRRRYGRSEWHQLVRVLRWNRATGSNSGSIPGLLLPLQVLLIPPCGSPCHRELTAKTSRARSPDHAGRGPEHTAPESSSRTPSALFGR